jgi:hypothetical protein
MVADSKARYKVLAAGRRWGKSRLGSALCVAEGLHGGRAWWVAPSYKVAAVGWRMIRRLGSGVPGVNIRRVDRMLELPGGGEVQVRSADDPDSLRGEGLDLVVLDECAFMKQAAWEEALRPALSDRQGDAVFISTPKGRNWFWRLWQRGIAQEHGFEAWQLPTGDNPYIPPDEIEAARLSLPELIFEQEYLAIFLENEGAVFRNIRQCMHAGITEPKDHKEHYKTMGVDWGRQNDFTALSVGCADCRLELAIDRFNQIDYHFQRQRLRVLAEKWEVTDILAEQNSMGDPIITEMQMEGLPVRPFETTTTSKPPLIKHLSLVLEKEEMQFINNPVWTGELEAYEQVISPITGRSRFSAPEGMNDDTVMARALMVHGAVNDRWLIY